MENKNRMAEELVRLLKRVDYDETVCTLKEQYAVPIQDFFFFFFCIKFLLDKCPFCGATDYSCFGLRVSFLMGFKARVDLLPALFQDFDKLEIAKWFMLDTSKCFTGKRKLKINQHCMYDIFVSYCGKDRFEVKKLMQAEIKCNWQWFNCASSVCLGMKSTDMVLWFKKQCFKNAEPDELCL